MKPLTEKQMLEVMRGRFGYGSTQAAFAKQAGISKSLLSEVLAGKKPITRMIAEKFGYRMDVSFYKESGP